MTESSNVGGAVEATFKLGGAYKRSNTQAYLVTTSGYTIFFDSEARTGSITMGADTYPVSDEAPEGGRRLETDNMHTPMIETLSKRQLAKKHEERLRGRQLFGWGGGEENDPHARELWGGGSFANPCLLRHDDGRQLTTPRLSCACPLPSQVVVRS